MTSFSPLKTNSSSSWAVENVCRLLPRVVEVVVAAVVHIIDVQTDSQWVCPIGAANPTSLLISSFLGATTVSRTSMW
jgi:hypothetical protein